VFPGLPGDTKNGRITQTAETASQIFLSLKRKKKRERERERVGKKEERKKKIKEREMEKRSLFVRGKFHCAV